MEGLQPEVFPNQDNIGVYTNKMHFVYIYFLEDLSNQNYYSEFMGPVDEEKVPNYYAIITTPMDIGAIKSRVENLYYANVNELIADVQLLINNCKKFYKPQDLVYHQCLELEDFFYLVLDQLPNGEEKPEKTLHECMTKLLRLNVRIAQMSQEFSNYIWSKFKDLAKQVRANHFKSIEDYDFAVCCILIGIVAELDSVDT